MKETPILFSAPMVRAILEGRKTQTRRIMKRQPTIDGQTGDWLFTYSDGGQEVSPIEQWIDIQVKLHCPYGKVGDRLWVRETFGAHPDYNPPYNFNQFVYRATDPDWETTENWKWKPSLFMPRSASRITLEITDISAELLQDISMRDAISEGIESFRPVPGDGSPETLYKRYSNVGGRPGNWIAHPELSFRSLWEKINGPDSWAQNPYVWVVKFKQITI